MQDVLIPVPVKVRSRMQAIRRHPSTGSKCRFRGEKVIGVISGKGWRWKIAGNSFPGTYDDRKRDIRQGILDADITGPSIPKMYGVHEIAIRETRWECFLCSAPDGTRIMSVNLLLKREDTPVIWERSVIAGVVTQFWSGCDVEIWIICSLTCLLEREMFR